MKRIFVLMAFAMSVLAVHAQKDVTRFLGIPVDGGKYEMIRKLKAKGFVSDYEVGEDWLKGSFNGHDVRVCPVMNGSKVYRIALRDVVGKDEASIRIRFNNLCYQFKNNPKYETFQDVEDYEIPEDEDISYGMTVKNKRYSATFWQKEDTLLMREEVQAVLLEKYGAKQMEELTDDIKMDEVMMRFKLRMNAIGKKTVWFMISESRGEYYINMYYDNGYNQANGEDL